MGVSVGSLPLLRHVTVVCGGSLSEWGGLIKQMVPPSSTPVCHYEVILLLSQF